MSVLSTLIWVLLALWIVQTIFFLLSYRLSRSPLRRTS